MEKVFSRIQWLRSAVNGGCTVQLIERLADGFGMGWVNECDGMTIEQMRDNGFICNWDWVVDKREYKAVSDEVFMQAVKAFLKLL